MKKFDKYKLQYNILVNIIVYTIISSPFILFAIALITTWSGILFLKQLAFIIIILTVILFYIILKNINIVKGSIGEAITRLIIQNYCSDSHYTNMNDIVLKNTILGYSQIDHIIITTKGIAVVETKYHVDYDIYGSEFDNTWTYGKKDKYKKYNKNQRNNPMKQNYGHIQAIKELIEDEDIQYYNIVSFIDTVTIKKCDIINKNSKCIYTYDLPKTIEELVLNDKTEKIGIAKMSKIICKLQEANITDRNIRREHIQNIKNNIK